ncbi:hypothetical protein ABK040_011209 [Willaertia magna]
MRKQTHLRTLSSVSHSSMSHSDYEPRSASSMGPTMMSEPMHLQSAVYGQRLNRSRCLVSVKGDDKNNRFLVGTCSLNSNNEVHLIEYQEEHNDVFCKGLYTHQHEIWNISSHPTNPKLFFTVYNTIKNGFEASLNGLPCYSDNDQDDDEENNSSKAKEQQHQDQNNLEQYCKLETKHFDYEKLHEVLWEPSGTTDRILTIDDKAIREFRLDHQSNLAKSCKFVNKFEVGGRRLKTAAWDPHHSEIIAVGAQGKIIQMDLREKNSKKNTIEMNAHDQLVRSIEYNPNLPNYLGSCGDDSLVKFWDVRNSKEPLRVVCGHSHWVCNVRFNPSYDQLVLTCSTDSKVNLWSISSISSKAKEKDLDDLEEGSGNINNNTTIPTSNSKASISSSGSGGNNHRSTDLFDSLVHSYDEQEESVYSVCWSNVDSWTFGSVSYDGRVLIHKVPKAEKLRVLNVTN